MAGGNTMEYEGSKTGVGNKFIKNGALVFARPKIGCEFTFIGRISGVEEIRAQTKSLPAKFKLTLDRTTFNLTESGKVLKRIDNAGGPKLSALRHMGFALKKGGANIRSGLNSIKSIPVEA
jgi:hypothetical protein